jgi:hypothetical protein
VQHPFLVRHPRNRKTGSGQAEPARDIVRFYAAHQCMHLPQFFLFSQST